MNISQKIETKGGRGRLLPVIGSILGVLALAALYLSLEPLSHWISFQLLGLAPESHLGRAFAFFIFEVPKVLILLVSVVFVVGVIRTFFTPQRTKAMLSGKRAFSGNVLAALLGVVTPFCSCSAVPLFIGFVASGVPLGATFSFLVSAPMVNEVALVLLWGLFGWKVAVLYMVTGLTIALVSGWFIGKLKLERWVEEWVFECQSPEETQNDDTLSWRGRRDAGFKAVREIVGRVWPYVLAGIAVGAGIHGYVPENFMASIMGRDAWWSVPLAVLIGVPMYSNAAGIIPVVQALLGKGAAMGTVLAFMMSVIGLSLPEAVILRKVLKLPLLAVFFSVVAVGIMLVGFLFNLLA